MVGVARTWPRELDGSCSCRDWGWKTEFSLDRTVRDFVEEYRSHRELYD
jgi:nucleoside-diphosphate-sugar epimerase